MEPTSGAAPAQWHVDPHDPGQLRYWDGTRWTEHTAPGVAYPAEVPRRTAGLAKASMWLASALAATELGLAATSFSYERALVDGSYWDDWFTAYDLVNMVFFTVALATYVVTCLWLYACRLNVELLRPAAHHQRGRVWIWLGWFLPPVSLWFPYQVVRDIGSGAKGKPPALPAWWALWLFALTPSTVVGFQSVIDSSMENVTAEAEVLSAALFTVGLILWIRIIRHIDQDQAALLDAMKATQRA